MERNLFCIVCFDFTAQAQFLCHGRGLNSKRISSAYQNLVKCSSICAENPANDCGKYVFKMFFSLYSNLMRNYSKMLRKSFISYIGYIHEKMSL